MIISSKTGHSRDEILDDQEVILATLNLKAMDFEESLRDAGLKGEDMEDSVDAQIKVITNLGKITAGRNFPGTVYSCCQDWPIDLSIERKT